MEKDQTLDELEQEVIEELKLGSELINLSLIQCLET